MQDNQEKTIIRIDASPILNNDKENNKILKVAAYCRVSTDMEDQKESYRAQVSYYTDIISKNPKWRLVGIYADEGITGTDDKKRFNFMRMIRDCEKGKIDFILTKSVARFARNTVDSLKYVRKLKSKGVGVYFEEQALDTLKTENEMAIGLYSVLAQAESENISANVKWGIRQRMKTGTYKFRYNIMGYKKGKNGEVEIDEEQAKIIREIYNNYLNGYSQEGIKKYLEEKGYLTFKGKKEWSASIIGGILKNEKYCGDMMLQKTYTENCITKKAKVNKGELPKYYIKNNHPAIIDRELFNRVQLERAKRNNVNKKFDVFNKTQGRYTSLIFSDILYCGVCGNRYSRRMVLRKDGKYHKIWRCASRIEHASRICATSKTVKEEVLKQEIINIIKEFQIDGKEIYEMIKTNYIYEKTKDDTFLEIKSLEKEIKELGEMMDKLVYLSVNSDGNSIDYSIEIRKIDSKIQTLKERLEINKKKLESGNIVNIEESFNKITDNSYSLRDIEENEYLIKRVIECIRIMPDLTIYVTFKGGLTIERKILKNKIYKDIL